MPSPSFTRSCGKQRPQVFSLPFNCKYRTRIHHWTLRLDRLNLKSFNCCITEVLVIESTTSMRVRLAESMENTTVPVCCYAQDEPMLQSAPSSPSALHLCWGQMCSPPILPTCSNIVRGLKSCSFRTSQTWSCLTDVCFCCCFLFQVEGLFLRISKHNFMDRFKVGCNWKGTPITSVRRQLEVPQCATIAKQKVPGSKHALLRSVARNTGQILSWS